MGKYGLKKFVLVFCVLCAGFFCSCDGVTEYTFENNSYYTIHITLSEPYKNVNSTEEKSTTSPFTVYLREKKTVYIQRSDVDFTWTTNSAGDNSKVYCEINGSKATFNNQRE